MDPGHGGNTGVFQRYLGQEFPSEQKRLKMTGKEQAKKKAKKNILGRWREAGTIGLGLLHLSSEPALGLPREVPLV